MYAIDTTSSGGGLDVHGVGSGAAVFPETSETHQREFLYNREDGY